MPDVTFTKRFEYPPAGTKGPVGSRTVYPAGFSGEVADAVAAAATAAGVLTEIAAPAVAKPSAKTASPPSPEIGEAAGGAKPA